MCEDTNSLISEWCPVITNITEDEKAIIKGQSSVFDKINNLKKETEKSEQDIIKEFKKIEEEIDFEFQGNT